MMEGGCPLISLCGVAKWAPLEHAAAGAIEPNSRKGENRRKEVRIAIGPNGSRRGHNNPMTLEHNVACSPCAVR